MEKSINHLEKRAIDLWTKLQLENPSSAASIQMIKKEMQNLLEDEREQIKDDIIKSVIYIPKFGILKRLRIIYSAIFFPLRFILEMASANCYNVVEYINNRRFM
jgi:hypothetical protein